MIGCFSIVCRKADMAILGMRHIEVWSQYIQGNPIPIMSVVHLINPGIKAGWPGHTHSPENRSPNYSSTALPTL